MIPKDATISKIMVNKVLRMVYVDFSPGETAARTVQAGCCEDGSYAFIDVDESNFPLALELRGWEQADIQDMPCGQPLGQEETVKNLFLLAAALIHGNNEEQHTISRATRYANELALAN